MDWNEHLKNIQRERDLITASYINGYNDGNKSKQKIRNKTTSEIFSKNILMVEKFIEHSISIGSIYENSTIKDLMNIINGIKECYIPLYSRIEEYINKFSE